MSTITGDPIEAVFAQQRRQETAERDRHNAARRKYFAYLRGEITITAKEAAQIVTDAGIDAMHDAANKRALKEHAAAVAKTFTDGQITEIIQRMGVATKALEAERIESAKRLRDLDQAVGDIQAEERAAHHANEKYRPVIRQLEQDFPELFR